MDELIENGACVFCGQVIAGDAACACAAAVAERKKQEAADRAHSEIDELFRGDGCDADLLEYLHAGASMIEGGAAVKITVDVSGTVQALLYEKKGAVYVRRTYKQVRDARIAD